MDMGPSPGTGPQVKAEPVAHPSLSPSQPNAAATPPPNPGVSASPDLHPVGAAADQGLQVAEGGVSPMEEEDSPAQNADDASDVGLPHGQQVVTQHVLVPSEVQQVLRDHSAFLHEQGTIGNEPPAVNLAHACFAASCRSNA